MVGCLWSDPWRCWPQYSCPHPVSSLFPRKDSPWELTFVLPLPHFLFISCPNKSQMLSCEQHLQRGEALRLHSGGGLLGHPVNLEARLQHREDCSLNFTLMAASWKIRSKNHWTKAVSDFSLIKLYGGKWGRFSASAFIAIYSEAYDRNHLDNNMIASAEWAPEGSL